MLASSYSGINVGGVCLIHVCRRAIFMALVFMSLCNLALKFWEKVKRLLNHFQEAYNMDALFGTALLLRLAHRTVLGLAAALVWFAWFPVFTVLPFQCYYYPYPCISHSRTSREAKLLWLSSHVASFTDTCPRSVVFSALRVEAEDRSSRSII